MTDVPRPGTRTEHVDVERLDAVPSRLAVRGHPIHPMLIPFPISFLVLAFGADVGLLVTGDGFFARAAQWLLALGVASGVLAMIPGAADFVTIERARRSTAGIAHAAANGAVILLALGNTVIRALGDPVGVVSPWGITLSAATALLLAVSGWFGGELSYRYLVGVDPKEALARRRGERLE